jgi:hypothetical protein
MKGIVVILGFILFIFSFSSCQKEYEGTIGSTDPTGTDTSGTVNTSFLVKTYTEEFTNSQGRLVSTFNLSYDAVGRITRMVSSIDTGNRLVFKYNTDDTYTMDLYVSNALSIHQVIFVNSLGLMDSTAQYNESSDTTTEKFTYTAGKQLVQLKEYEILGSRPSLINTTNFEYDSNQNIIKVTDQNSVTTYEYYSDLLNTLNMGQVYSTRNRNLPKTTTVTSGGAETINHTYTFDNLNRVTSDKATTAAGSDGTAIYTFTY